MARWLGSLAGAAVLTAAGSAHAARPTLANEATFGVGEILVHYATSGTDAAPVVDIDANGTPDFVEEVATTANAALTDLVALGFARPRADGTLGGDGRIDVYLRNLVSADGNTSTDSCANNTCIGYAIVENDYLGYSYPSITEAIRSVVPHELFHLIQYAYAMDQSATWTEGTAVWAVEHLHGEGNADFERFVPSFLAKTFRPFERPATGFGDAYPYGTALWPAFLAQRGGAQLVREAWERCATTDFLTAIDEVMIARGSSLRAEWTTFTRWNGFTGPYAVAGGYPFAAALPAAPREPALTDLDAEEVYVEGYAARYLPVTVTEDASLVLAPTGGITVAGFVVPLGAPLAEGRELTGDAVRQAVALAPGRYALVVTGLSPMTITTAVHVSLEPATAEIDPGDGGCAVGGTRGALPVSVALLGLLVPRRRRRVPGGARSLSPEVGAHA